MAGRSTLGNLVGTCAVVFLPRRVEAWSLGKRVFLASADPDRRPERLPKPHPPQLRTVPEVKGTDVQDDPAELPRNPKVVQNVPPSRSLLLRWAALPSRYKLLFATGVAFVICNMVSLMWVSSVRKAAVQDKVNMSVAIIPMARQFGWSATISGLVQSAFFYGYMLFQLPAGFMNTAFSGARMLPIGVSIWSAATTVVPMLGSSVAGLCLSRAVVGVGEAVAPASLTDLISSIVPVSERSRSMTFVSAALYVGSLLGLILSPYLVERSGWPSVFYCFGGVGLIWTVWWLNLLGNIQRNDPLIYAKLIENRKRHRHQRKDIPWRAMLRCRPLYALMYTHFCNNWFHFAVMAWLPSYFTDTLSLSLTRAAQISLIPPAAAISASLISGPTADHLISRGWRIGLVRKLAQCTAFLGPSLCLMAASYPPLSHRSIIFIAAALGLASFSLAGLYCNHQDLSPQYSSLLLGITNTAGALTGVLGVAVTGALLDYTGSWTLALFAPSIFFFVTGSIVFTLFGSGEEADFSNNDPFPFEQAFKRYAG